METFFAAPDRTEDSELQKEIASISNSPLMKVFLKSQNCLFAVLDKNRQIITLNDHYLKYLNDIPAEKILGLRMGESLNCIHSMEAEGGCGTSPHCRTCGAAMAITSAIAQNEAVEQVCALELDENGVRRDLYFQVKCEPFFLEDRKFYMLFLKDETKAQQRRMLEKTFFHDFSNILGGLSTSTYMLSRGIQTDQIIDSVCTTTNILVKEIEIQRCLMHNDLDYYSKSLYSVSVEKLFMKLENVFSDKAVDEKKVLHFHRDPAMESLKSDEVLLIRILTNMISNALEASEKGEHITVNSYREGNDSILSVHNSAFIPRDIQLRLFQKNFSTKGGEGRGIGTYSMKLFGEQVLGGRIGFTSSPEKGTEFYFRLPC